MMRGRIGIIACICILMIMLCSCGEMQQQYRIKDVSFTLPGDWVVEDIMTYANSIEDENKDEADYLKSRSQKAENGLVEEDIITNDSMPQWLMVYCFELAGTNWAKKTDEIKQNWRDDKEYDLIGMEEIEVDSVKGLKVSAKVKTDSGKKVPKDFIYFIANGYQYSFECFNEDDNMTPYLEQLLNGITIEEDVNETSMGIGKISWILKGIWKEDENAEEEAKEYSEEEDTMLVEALSMSSDSGQAFDFETYPAGIYKEPQEIVNTSGDSEGMKLIKSQLVNNDQVGDIAVIYNKGENGGYHAFIYFSYKKLDYTGYVFAEKKKELFTTVDCFLESLKTFKKSKENNDDVSITFEVIKRIA